MSKRERDATPRRIDRTAMDALLYGLLKSLDYLGEKKRPILDRMGSVMLEYLAETGNLPSSDKPESAQSLRGLLARNGYGPQTPSPSNLVEILAPKQRPLKRGASPKGGATRVKEKVDWVLYETVLYGMTKALDEELGVQAQLILDRIGTGMLDYLLGVGAIQPSDDMNVLVSNVTDYFVKAGYAKSFQFELEGAPPDTFVSRYESAPYYTTVFRRIQKEGSALLSCPLCLVGHSIWANGGWKFGDIFEVHISPGGKVLMKAKVYPKTERFTEEDALKVAQMKV